MGHPWGTWGPYLLNRSLGPHNFCVSYMTLYLFWRISRIFGWLRLLSPYRCIATVICHCACTLNDMCIKDKGSFRIRYCCWYMVVEIWRVEEHTTKHYIRLLTTAQVDFSCIIIGYTADPNLTISFKILDHLVWRNFISFLSGSSEKNTVILLTLRRLKESQDIRFLSYSLLNFSALLISTLFAWKM